jgi:hypothetical protein
MYALIPKLVFPTYLRLAFLLQQKLTKFNQNLTVLLPLSA